MTTQATPDFNTMLADQRKATETAQALASQLEALVNEQRATIDALTFEMGAVDHAAHMPVDYTYGLPTWINMVLYAAYIGLDIGPHNQAWAERLEERWDAAVRELRTIRDERDGLMSRLGEAIQTIMVREGL